MIECKTYEEAKLTAISILSRYGSYAKNIQIEYSKKYNTFYVDYEEFEWEDDFLINMAEEEEKRNNLKKEISELQEKIDDLEMKIAEKKKEMGL